MLLRLLLASALTVPMFAYDDDDRYNRRDRDGRWSRQDRDRWERNNRRNDRYRNRDNRPGYGYGRDRIYRNDPYGGGYGYGNSSGYGNQAAVINRTMQNLRSAASRNRVDGHERDHLNRAMSELQNMRYNQGYPDSRSLSRVLEDLDHLSRADQINPRDRQILARDRQALASMSGGYGYNRY